MSAYPIVSNVARAQSIARDIRSILVNQLQLDPPEKFVLTEHGQFTWLLAIMDDVKIRGSFGKYIKGGNDSVVHRLSTNLDGLPVYLSNHSGLRYAVLMSEPPRLPARVDYPDADLDTGIVPFGVGFAGPIHERARDVVNMIVVGSQDSGKSMALRALAHSQRRQGAQLCLADSTHHTFNPDYWEAASVLPIARNKNEFRDMLLHVDAEVQRRVEKFKKAAIAGIQPEDIDAYNKQTGEAMPRLWMIADEVNSLIDAKMVQDALDKPAREGRKYGVHMVLAGHDWHEKTVPRGLTDMFATRLCLRTASDTAGNTVLNDVARGRRTMTFNRPGRGILRVRDRYMDVQLYYLAPEREIAWIDEIRSTSTRKWDGSALEVPGSGPEVPAEVKAEVNPQFLEVLKMIGEGASDAEIARKVFDAVGGRSFYKAKEIIQDLRTSSTSTSSTTSQNQPESGKSASSQAEEEEV